MGTGGSSRLGLLLLLPALLLGWVALTVPGQAVSGAAPGPLHAGSAATEAEATAGIEIGPAG